MVNNMTYGGICEERPLNNVVLLATAVLCLFLLSSSLPPIYAGDCAGSIGQSYGG